MTLMVNVKPKKEKNYPLTGNRQNVDSFDVTPKILYKNRIAVNVTTYCVVNGYTLATSDYALTDRGFTESHFDEYHGIGGRPQVVSKSRLEELDSNNPHSIPLLKVLGLDRESVERILRENRLNAYHVDTDT